MADQLEGRHVKREQLIDVALGDEPSDVIVANGTILNVHTGRLLQMGVAIKGDRIAAVGDVAYTQGPATRIVDARHLTLIPGLLSPHCHQWHSNHNGTVFAQGLLKHGTTAITDGIYGPGIVAGKAGVRFFLDEMLATPLKVFFLVPTPAYLQLKMIGHEPAPASVSADDLFEMLEWPECRGVEETDGYVIGRNLRDPVILEVFERALASGKVVTGHGPNIWGRDLNAWIAAGVMNNHEFEYLEQATTHTDFGLYGLLREAPSIRNVAECARAITELRYDSRCFQLDDDLVTADSLFEGGTVHAAVTRAIQVGVDPIRAVQMATIQPAEFFRVNHEVGVIAPGRRADIVFLTDLATLSIQKVMANGAIVVEDDEFTAAFEHPQYPRWMYDSMTMNRQFVPDDFRVSAPAGQTKVKVRVIGITNGMLNSTEEECQLDTENGEIVPDASRGINKVVVIDRLRSANEYAVGFVRGFELRAGSIGSSANSFVHGVLVVGTSNGDMAAAVDAIVRRNGAFVAVRDGEVTSEFPLPLLGLCSDLPYARAKEKVRELFAAWRDLGCELEAPSLYFELLVGANYPTLRITTKGLRRVSFDDAGGIDLQSYEAVPVVVEDQS